MRNGLIGLWMLLCPVTSAIAEVSISIGLPNVSIGINVPMYPELVPVPGYPVYYAPRLDSNFFFYDGMYWVYQGDNWYASSWYNGPWELVDPEYMPLYVLRVPVRYYQRPPMYFRGWRSDASPRWGEHWGPEWEQRRSGWDRWNRNSVPAPAPLPVYQREYSGTRYPGVEQQRALHRQSYGYQPHDAIVRQHFQKQGVQKAPAPSLREGQGEPRDRSPRQQNFQRANPSPPLQPGSSDVPRSQPRQRGSEGFQRVAPAQTPPQERGPAVQQQRQQPQHEGAPQREQQVAPRSQEGQKQKQQGKGASQKPKRDKRQGQEKDQGQDKDREKGDERGQKRNE